MGRHRLKRTNVYKYNNMWWTIIPGPDLNVSVFATWREAYDHAFVNTPVPVKVA